LMENTCGRPARRGGRRSGEPGAQQKRRGTTFTRAVVVSEKRSVPRRGPEAPRRAGLPARAAGAGADNRAGTDRSSSGHSGSDRCAAAPDSHRLPPKSRPRPLDGRADPALHAGTPDAEPAAASRQRSLEEHGIHSECRYHDRSRIGECQVDTRPSAVIGSRRADAENRASRMMGE
jgi:hypothetical protein